MKGKFTIMLPVHKRFPSMTIECLKCLLEESNLNIVCLVDSDDTNKYFEDERISFIYNKIKKPPLVKLWNQCIKECPTDNVIIASWRQRPTKKHFEIIERKLKEGYGIVTFDGLHFFGLNKYLTKIIGFFDEGFKRGQFEDTDWFNRLKANNIAIYMGKIDEQRVSDGEIVNSMWLDGADANKKYYESKWINDSKNKRLIQLKNEVNFEDRKYFGNVDPIKYKPWNQSVLSSNLKNYFNLFPEYLKN